MSRGTSRGVIGPCATAVVGYQTPVVGVDDHVVCDHGDVSDHGAVHAVHIESAAEGELLLDADFYPVDVRRFWEYGYFDENY